VTEELDIVPKEYFKKLIGTDDLWEVRIQSGNNIFRILGFFDGKNLVILNHAFIKKSQKIPKKEIKLAEKRKLEYLKEQNE
jgi:phage-related protein